MKTFFRRAFAVLRWDEKVFDEVAADPNATIQAAALVFLSALPAVFTLGLVPALFAGVVGLIFWGALALIIQFIGTRMSKPAPSVADLIADSVAVAIPEEGGRRVGFGQVLRATGFAYAPSFFANLVLIPLELFPYTLALFGAFLRIPIVIWVAGAYFGSISTVFDTTMWRAFVVFLVSLAILGVALFLIVFLFGALAALVGLTPT